jgi:hypothetical protein
MNVLGQTGIKGVMMAVKFAVHVDIGHEVDVCIHPSMYIQLAQTPKVRFEHSNRNRLKQLGNVAVKVLIQKFGTILIRAKFNRVGWIALFPSRKDMGWYRIILKCHIEGLVLHSL